MRRRKGVKLDSGNSPEPAKKILALIGSPRKLGNCELFVKEISRHIPIDHQLALIRLPSLNIRPCIGCYHCIDDDDCPMEDDISFLIREISSCDGLMIASPVYFLGTHMSVKAVLDRTFAFYNHLSSIRGKPCILINTYGMKDSIGTAPQTLRTFASFLGLHVRDSMNIKAALPGEVLTNDEYMNTAVRLGNRFFSLEKHETFGRACPFCGNDIVMMRDQDFLCTLCHGVFIIKNDGSTVEKSAGWHLEDTRFVDNHREWLKGMKAQFLKTKKDMLRRILPYSNEGQWLVP
jgi:multimeric flavodoxin WrbA